MYNRKPGSYQVRCFGRLRFVSFMAKKIVEGLETQSDRVACQVDCFLMRAGFRRVMPNPTSIDPAAHTGWKRRGARTQGRKEISWALFASWCLCGLALNDFDFRHGWLPLLF